MVEVKKRYGAYLMVDEAHSLGIFGARGRGVAEEAGVLDEVDFIVGTFSKTLGATGGYCASRHDVLPLVRLASRPYIFTASPCPSVIATTRTALRLVAERPELRERLWDNARRLYAGLEALQLELGPEVSPVVAVRFASAAGALVTWRAMLERGVYTNLIVPPASPDGSSLLRCSASAAHTPEQIDAIIAAFAATAR
jgi:8-amino-7-oxononanoate synthase